MADIYDRRADSMWQGYNNKTTHFTLNASFKCNNNTTIAIGYIPTNFGKRPVPNSEFKKIKDKRNRNRNKEVGITISERHNIHLREVVDRLFDDLQKFSFSTQHFVYFFFADARAISNVFESQFTQNYMVLYGNTAFSNINICSPINIADV